MRLANISMLGLLGLSAVAAAVQSGCGDTTGEVTQTGTNSTGMAATGGAGQAGSNTGGGGAGGSGQCIAGLKSIALTPDNSTVMLDGGPAKDIVFTAMGKLSAGPDIPIAADGLTWTAKR